MPHSEPEEMFPCLGCGNPTPTGAFCGDACERWIGTDIPDDPGDPDRRIREVLLEAMCWGAYREALHTGVWH